jgi:hypothetical protein
MPLIALLGLVHFRLTGASVVLGRGGCGNQSGVDHRAFSEQQALGRLRGVDGGKNLNAQVVCFKQVEKPKDGDVYEVVVDAIGTLPNGIREEKDSISHLMRYRENVNTKIGWGKLKFHLIN